jgi:hypothetical protein
VKILKFEDMIAWQKSQDFAVSIYGQFSNINLPVHCAFCAKLHFFK